MTNRTAQTPAGLLRWSGLAALLASTALLGACAQVGNTGSNSAAALLAPQPHEQKPGDELGRAVAYWGKKFQKNPRDKKAALAYAKNLKFAGQKQQALAVLRYASTFQGNDREIASEYGRLALAAGQVQLAQKLLAVADDSSNPDWRVVLGRGTALAKQGQYKAAIPHFERALRLAPSNPTALSNLAMAKAGAGDLKEAEALLRKAMMMPNAKPTVRRNLTVVLKLMGQNEEARRIAAGGNAAPIRTTVGQPQIASPVNRNGRTVASASPRPHP